MTTSFAYTLRGEVGAAMHAQPAGFVGAVVSMMVAGVSLLTLLTGKVAVPPAYRLSPQRMITMVVAIILFGWVYKLAAGILGGTLPYS